MNKFKNNSQRIAAFQVRSSQTVPYCKVFSRLLFIYHTNISGRHPFIRLKRVKFFFFHNKLEETEKQLGTNTATFSLSKVQRILNAIFLPLSQHPKRTENVRGDCCEEEGLKRLWDGGGELSSVWNCCLLITKCVMRYSYIYQSPKIVLNCIIRI